MNHAAARSQLVQDGGPPHCPKCRAWLRFECDRQGRIVETCECGHRALIVRRDSTPAPAVEAAVREP